MNPFENWKPRRPSPELRESLFGRNPAPRNGSSRRPGPSRPFWPSVGLVLGMSWSGTLLLWLHGDIDMPKEPPVFTVSTALALVAQNSIPVATTSFAFTNSALIPSTNASFSGPTNGRY